MANLIKITEVQLHIGPGTDTEVAECLQCKQILSENAIPHKTHMFLFYGDDAQKLQVLGANVFGPDFSQYEFKTFPVITWKEYYDDYERFMQVATRVEQLNSSNVVLHKDKVTA